MLQKPALVPWLGDAGPEPVVVICPVVPPFEVLVGRLVGMLEGASGVRLGGSSGPGWVCGLLADGWACLLRSSAALALARS